MSNVYRPFGLQFVGNLSGSHGNEVRAYPLPNGAACPDFYRGSPIGRTAGVLVSAGAGGGPLLGVGTGYAWVDPTTRQPIQRNSIPADVSSAGILNGYSSPVAYVVDNPHALFWIQADGTVSAGDLGLNFNVTVSGGDDTINGISRHALDASTRTSAITGTLKLTGLAAIDGNAWGNAFPIVEVVINRSVLTDVSAS